MILNITKLHKTFMAIALISHTDITNQHMNLNNGDNQQYFFLLKKKQFMPQSMLGASTHLPACIAALINYAVSLLAFIFGVVLVVTFQ